MVRWKATVDIKDLHDAYGEGKVAIAFVAGEVAKRLCQTPYGEDCAMLDIIEQFESLADEGEKAEVAEYDRILADLYDFADEDHRLWVNTTIRRCG